MTISYTTNLNFPLLDDTSNNWGAVLNGVITTLDDVVLHSGTPLTSGKIPVATTGGELIDLTPQTELTDELTTITFTEPSTPDYAIQDLTDSGGFGFVTKDEGNSVLKVIVNLQTRVNELETKLTALGLLADAD
jgi:hypothetical protein